MKGGKNLNNFQSIKDALEYIDSHLDEQISLESISKRFHFFSYYFHRMFSVIVGKTIAVHIRDRRLSAACKLLFSTDQSVLNIALDSGYNLAQSFTRAFKDVYGVSPTTVMKYGCMTAINVRFLQAYRYLTNGSPRNIKLLKYRRQNMLRLTFMSQTVTTVRTTLWING